MAQVVPTQAEPAPAPTPPSPPQIEAIEEQSNALIGQARAMDAMKNPLSEISRNLGMVLPRSSASTVLVIPASEMKAEDLASVVEDMTVMARIIDKQMGQEQSRQAGFYGDFFGQSSRMAQTMYLQGYGMLFLRKVDFLLSPPPKTQEPEKQTKEEATDPVWEQTRRDMYEPQEDRRRREERPEEKYDVEKVENLKINIIKALKHATNIRSLKTDESVILTITGSGDSSNAKILVSTSATGSNVLVQKGDSLRTTGIAIPSLDSRISSTTTLVIRAKKADIDAFAKGELDLDKFRQRVQIFIQ
jgi:hypothetical protein